MNVIDLSRIQPLTGWTAYSTPFIRRASIGVYTLATYWKVWTGETDGATTTFINQILELSSITYNAQTSLADCLSQPRSFYWDDANQLLYVHLIHTSDFKASHFSYGEVQGFCDEAFTYIGGIEYQPRITKSPTVSLQTDLVNYNALAFNSGTVSLDNTDGGLDEIINSPIYGNLVQMFWAPSGQCCIDRDALVPVASFYVENYNFTISSLDIKVQDRRKEQNAQIATEYLSDGTLIPLVFGTPRVAKALVVDPESTGSVVYQVGTYLQSVGVVEVDIDGVWTAVTPISTDLGNGKFTLSATDGRVDGVSTNGARDCRVRNCQGYTVNHASDIIVKLNELVLDLTYNDSNYNLDEWNTEQESLAPCAIVFDTETMLFEAIATIQNGANVGFRYEIGGDNRRTIRIDDRARAQTFSIDPEDIVNQESLPVESDSTLLAANYTVKYAKDHNYGKFLTLQDDSSLDYVLNTYRQMPTLTVESNVLTEPLAQEKIDWLIERFKDVPRVAKVKVVGGEFMTLRLLDTGTVDLSCIGGGREYFGIHDCMVVGVSPDFTTNTNTLQLVFI